MVPCIEIYSSTLAILQLLLLLPYLILTCASKKKKVSKTAVPDAAKKGKELEKGKVEKKEGEAADGDENKPVETAEEINRADKKKAPGGAPNPRAKNSNEKIVSGAGMETILRTDQLTDHKETPEKEERTELETQTETPVENTEDTQLEGTNERTNEKTNETQDETEESSTTGTSLTSGSNVDTTSKDTKETVVEVPTEKGAKIREISVQPGRLHWFLSGGKQKLHINNTSGERHAIKVKCSDNGVYKVNPVYAFVGKNSSVELEVTRLSGRGKSTHDILNIVTTTAVDSDTDVVQLFKKPATFPNVLVPLDVMAPA